MGALSSMRRAKKVLMAIAIGVVATGVALAVTEFRLFTVWELKTYDLRMRLMRRDRPQPENVVLFYVDEPSLRTMEAQGVNWPWPRELYAMALDFCRRGGARAVVFDLFFSEESVYGVADDEAFARGVEAGPPADFVLFLSEVPPSDDPREATVLAKSHIPFAKPFPGWMPREHSLASLPIAPLVTAAHGFGNAQIPPDEDGIYRRVDLAAALGEQAVPSIALKVASDLRDPQSIRWPRPSRFYIGEQWIPLAPDGRMMVNYYGGADTFPSYSLSDILFADAALAEGGTPEIGPAVVADKIVIIGVAAPGLYDLKPTPLARVYPGPEVHATILENILTNDFITPLSRRRTIAISLLFGLAASLGLAGIATSWGVGLYLGALAAVLVGGGFALFAAGTWFPLVAPFGSLSLSAFTMILYNFLTEGRKKRAISKAFGQYLSPHVVGEIAKDPNAVKLGGIGREVTLFFSDVANFTTISEGIAPEELVTQLNDYFTAASEIIRTSDGTLDKYIGDAIMAFWGAPLSLDDHALRGVRVALAIQERLQERGLFVTRIGLHTGRVVVGNIGSDLRLSYTVIGDAVNLASRLEGLNKQFGTPILMSETTAAQAGVAIRARRIGRVRVKGRQAPIGIFEPLGLAEEPSPLDDAALETFAEALDRFERGGFADAAERFAAIAGDDIVAEHYLEHCRAFVENPPEHFDGVITFTSK